MIMRLVTPAKYIVLSLFTLVILSIYSPLHAQEITDHADFFAEEAFVFLTIQNTDDSVEALHSLINRLNITDQASFNGSQDTTPLLNMLKDMSVITAMERSVTLDEAWIGDQISLGVHPLANNNTTFETRVIFEIADQDAFLQSVNSDLNIQQQGEYVLIGSAILVIGDTLIYSETVPNSQLVEAIETHKPLSDFTDYQEALADLPAEDYLITGYIKTSEALQDIMSTNPQSFSANTSTTFDVLKNMGFGIGYTPDDRTITLDLSAPSLTLEADIAPISLDFVQNIPANVQFMLHGNNADSLLQIGVNALNHFSPLVEQNVIDGYQLFNMGGLFKQSLITLIAGFTGLNVERDVIQKAQSDYALVAKLVPDAEMTELAFLAHITDEDAVDYIFDSLTEAGQGYGINLNIQDHHLHAPNLITSLLVLEGGPVAPHPSFELSAIYRANLLALGSTPLVNHAIGGDGTLIQQANYQEGRGKHLDDILGMIYINVNEIADQFSDGQPDISNMSARGLDDLQFALEQLELVIVSFALQDETPISRITIKLSDYTPTNTNIDGLENPTVGAMPGTGE